MYKHTNAKSAHARGKDRATESASHFRAYCCQNGQTQALPSLLIIDTYPDDDMPATARDPNAIEDLSPAARLALEGPAGAPEPTKPRTPATVDTNAASEPGITALGSRAEPGSTNGMLDRIKDNSFSSRSWIKGSSVSTLEAI